MAERTPERLVRLLGMVAYLDSRPGVPIEEIAAHFGVSRRQVLDDVDTLWMSGTPGYWPDDLIDFDADSLDSGIVRLTQARGMTRPLRLGTREAVALIAALRALQESVGSALGPEQRDVLASTLEVLTAATGEAASTVDVRLSVEARPEVVAAVRTALADGRQLHLRYVNASDVVSERDVDPWQMLTGDEHSYLRAWCHSARGERLFRLDRILGATVGERPVEHRRPTSLDAETFKPAQEHELVSIELSGRARWVAEQLPVERIDELADHRFRVTLRASSPAWLQQLLLRLAADVLDVQPAEAARDASAAASRALRLYEG
jgi:proteasome accessory factor C